MCGGGEGTCPAVGSVVHFDCRWLFKLCSQNRHCSGAAAHQCCSQGQQLLLEESHVLCDTRGMGKLFLRHHSLLISPSGSPSIWAFDSIAVLVYSRWSYIHHTPNHPVPPLLSEQGTDPALSSLSPSMGVWYSQKWLMPHSCCPIWDDPYSFEYSLADFLLPEPGRAPTSCIVLLCVVSIHAHNNIILCCWWYSRIFLHSSCCKMIGGGYLCRLLAHQAISPKSLCDEQRYWYSLGLKGWEHMRQWHSNCCR